jgi:hypothetical protein
MQVESHVESAWYQRLKATYDEPVSIFAFIFNVRPYIKNLRFLGRNGIPEWA